MLGVDSESFAAGLRIEWTSGHDFKSIANFTLYFHIDWNFKYFNISLKEALWKPIKLVANIPIIDKASLYFNLPDSFNLVRNKSSSILSLSFYFNIQ